MSADFYIKQGDTAPDINGVLVDDAGAAVNIEGASLHLTMRPLEGGTAVLAEVVASNGQNGDAATAEANGTKGAWSYAWQAADTALDGYFQAEVKATYADSSVETFPNDGYLTIRITPKLG